MRKTAEERFWAKVQKGDSGDCWPWLGARLGSKQEYGQFYASPARGCVPAHRYSYELNHGPIPPRHDVDHVDCWTKLCVNPAHLEAVTHRENTLRGDGGGHNARKTHCPHDHEYTEANTYRTGDGKRRCRTCLSRAAKLKAIVAAG